MRTDFARLAAVLLSLIAGRAAVADWHVWTVMETRHVLRSELPGGTLAVKVAAARNEWVSFQILVRSDEPVNAVCVEPAELRGPAAAVLHTSESRLYRQHQLQIEIGTYRNDTFKPDWYPDPLIPCRVGLAPPEGSGGASPTLQAMPFDLPANETNGFWVDLYVPADTPPGEYRGVYRVTAEGGRNLEVPVVLTVWGFTLPATPTLVTAFGSPAQRLRDYYRQRAKGDKEPEPSNWAAVETQCSQLLSEHRFNATPPAELLRPVAQSDGSFRIPAEQVQALRQFVDRYHVNALDVPHPSSVIKDPVAQRDKLRAWLAAFERMAKELDRPQVVLFVYLKDEPNTREDYEYVQKWGRAIRAAKSVVQVMVVEQTWTESGKGGADSDWGDLYGAVDIWCPLFSLHRQDSAAKRQVLGETIWTYTALCQGPPTPWWHIDYPLLNYRVPAWMAWRDRMKGLLYWGGMSYWRETDDPWVHVPVYTGRGVYQQGDKGIRFNGEGSLVYPARAVGYDGIVPTIRLKALRDAVEDYEYLAILDRLGKSAEADKIVRRLTESWFQWDKDPTAYEKARAELAALIVAESKHAAKRQEPLGQGLFRQHLADYDSELRGPDGRVDIDGMVARLKELGVTTYYWLIWHAPTDWEDLKRFLPKAAQAGIDVWVYLVPPSESPPRFSTLYSEPFRLDYHRWAEEIARLSLQHANLTAWVIDDFYANHEFFTPAYLREMQVQAKRINPRLAFLPLMYFDEIRPKFAEDYRDVIDGVVVAYLQDRDEIEWTWAILNDAAVVPPGEISYPWDSPSQAGDFVMVSQSVQVRPADRYVLSFRERDNFTGPTAGYHFKQVLVDGAVVWDEDVAGGSPAWRKVTVNVTEQVRGKPSVTVALRLLDKKGVSNFGVRWHLSELRTENLQLGAELAESAQWKVDRHGAFETGFGGGAKAGQRRFHIPFISMTAGDQREFRQRHGDPATPERVAEYLRVSLQTWRDGKCDGVVTYCLDKRPQSRVFPPARDLFREFRRDER